jgi:hypothetical protein
MAGDIARYWYFLNDREGSVIAGARQDASPFTSAVPRVSLRGGHRAGDQTGAEPGIGPTPRGGRGRFAMPDIFYTKARTIPARHPEQPGRLHLPARVIPVSQVLERTCGNYVAFSCPPPPSHGGERRG